MFKHEAKHFKILTDARGQAMVEFCVAVPVLILLLWSIWYVSDLYIVKLKTLSAARYGAWLLSKDDDLRPEDVKPLIAANFFDNNTNRLTLTIPDSGEEDLFSDIVHSESVGEAFVDLIMNIINEVMGSKSIYSLKVEYEMPLIFGAVDVTEFRDKPFQITSEHYVVGNTWHGCRTDVHDLISLIGELIEEAFEELKDALGL
ncbi:MAG: hypothetical protein AMK69_01550 [Nitrospira bacterium SG8_3]|nr:MAG: hypothetical protein AMK69_01550 [Nitrospira bacterium SG8_3]